MVLKTQIATLDNFPFRYRKSYYTEEVDTYDLIHKVGDQSFWLDRKTTTRRPHPDWDQVNTGTISNIFLPKIEEQLSRNML